MGAHAAAPAAFDDVTAYLRWDHRRLEALLAEVCRRIAAGEIERARKAYRGFDEALARHFRIEEELVFPLFKVKAGLLGGPTAALSAEHGDIRQAVGIMRAALDRRDPGAFHDGLRFLRGILPDHDAKEEHVLLPTLDSVLTERERAAVVRRLVAE